MAYGQSKTANIWMANELERRYGGQGVHALSVHPGVIMTNLARHLDPAVFDRWNADEGFKRIMKSPAQGAATTVWAALGRALEGTGGLYLEECRVAEKAPDRDDLTPKDPGYAAHAYDPAGERRLWEESCRMVGVVA